MRVLRYSLIPLEFLDPDVCRRFVTNLPDHCGAANADVPDLLTPIADPEIDEVVCLDPQGGFQRAIYRLGSACVLVLLREGEMTRPTFEGAVRDLNERQALHREILESFHTGRRPEIADVVNTLSALKLKRSVLTEETKAYLPSYVFSFSIIHAGRKLTAAEDKIVKLHAQPALLGIEDTPGLRRKTADSPTLRADLLEGIQDCDTITGVHTYCTWATVNSTIESRDVELFLDTAGILLMLELKLQATWNKCSVLSNYCDRVARKREAGNLGRRLSWLLVGTLDDARTIVNSMASDRVNRLFQEIVETSGLEGEILRAERKLQLVNELLDWERERQGMLYQRTTETLLLIVAVAQAASLFFDGPVFESAYGPVALGLMALIGAATIWFRRS